MATPRRWFQFSLRGFIVILTIGCLWLGWKVDRARKQREAVDAIEASTGWVFYDWQLGYSPVSGLKKLLPSPLEAERPEPEWVRRLGGDDLLHEVWMVDFSYMTKESEILKSIPYLPQLRGLQVVIISNPTISDKTANKIKATVPDCEVRFAEDT